MTTVISNFQGIQVLDSRGRPTVCARMMLSDGSVHKATVPSGASTGAHEALELRDGETEISEKLFLGKSVHQAVSNINEIIRPRLLKLEPNSEKIDAILHELDSTSRHEILGANATLATSLVGAIASAHVRKVSLARFYQPHGALKIPMPMVNILSGGAHAAGALDIQDVLVIPHGAKTFAQGLTWVSAIREKAAELGASDGFMTNLVADEGGLGLPFASSDMACGFITHCIESVGLNPRVDVSLALDIAATQFYKDEKYESRSQGLQYTPEQWSQLLLALVATHPIISIEDPFAEDDWDSWELFMKQLPRPIQVVGDDLFTTNTRRLSRGIKGRSANAILIKPNQNGLVTSTHDVLTQAQYSGLGTIVSARSGESEDSWLADLATGWNAGQIKVGSTHGSERTAKWNRLLELEATEETVFSKPF